MLSVDPRQSTPTFTPLGISVPQRRSPQQPGNTTSPFVSADAVLPLMTTHRSGGRGASPKLGGRPQVRGARVLWANPFAQPNTRFSRFWPGREVSSAAQGVWVTAWRRTPGWGGACRSCRRRRPRPRRPTAAILATSPPCLAGRCPQVWWWSRLTVAQAAVP